MSKRNEWNPRNCPTWCTNGSNEYPCRGEHSTRSIWGYTPVSAGYFDDGGSRGVTVPAIGVVGFWEEHWGGCQMIALHIGSDTLDEQYDMKLSEALTLVTSLTEVMSLMVAEGVRIPMHADRIENVLDYVQRIRNAHINPKVKS